MPRPLVAVATPRIALGNPRASAHHAAANFISLIASLFDTHPPTRLVA